MPVTTGVVVDDGSAVVVKRATGGHESIEALRREGERLRRASHPGVVPVVRSVPEPDGWQLVTTHAGPPLRALGILSAAQVGTIAAAVASTLADLHDLGLVHGRIDASHVLLGEHGRPRLCGLGDGRDPSTPEDDVAALGQLIVELLGADEEAEPIPDRRWRRGRRWSGWERRALLTLADQATADPPSRRPTARRLAAAISEAVPHATPDALPPAPQGSTDDDAIERLRPDPDEASPPRRFRAPVAAALTGVALVVIAVVRFSSGGGEEARVVSPPTEPDVPAPVEELAAPVEGGVLVFEGRRYRVGEQGDHLLLGDWRCDGRLTPALFRPSSHEVFLFDRWTADAPLSIEPTVSVPGAVRMVSRRDDDGCPRLEVRTASGARVPIALGGLQ